MSEEFDQGDPNRKRRRRRRRRRTPQAGEAPPPSAAPPRGDPERERRRGAPRRQSVELPGGGPLPGPNVSVPASGRNPFRKRGSRPKRTIPGSVAARRRRLNRPTPEVVQAWLGQLPEPLLASLVRGLGGQPGRGGGSSERLVGQAAKAILANNRVQAAVQGFGEKERKAVGALLQCGGIAHADEFHRELAAALGQPEREWKKVLLGLANKGLLLANGETDGQFFYVVPEVLFDLLLVELGDEMVLPVFDHGDVKVLETRPFCPPLEFSITSLATYIDQRAPRLTQRQEVHRHDKDAMDHFFAQIWEADSELFQLHLDFLMMHGMVELRGETLALQRDVMEEWLQLEAEDQRDLVFRALDRRFDHAEWVLWAIAAATRDRGEAWVAERPLSVIYRRWKRGDDWRERLRQGRYGPGRSNERDSWSFSPLVRAGLLELGQWGQEKFYRLSARGRQLLEPGESDGFERFYLTPSFEIMAPAGLAPLLLFRIGELAELTGCDRANTYRITELSTERAIERGWRREDALQFLRDNSEIGLPENVEVTLRGWIGHRGDVEFHDLLLVSVHRSQIRRLEGHRRVKPYLLHRFAPGLYAVDRSRRDEVAAVLAECGFSPSRDTRAYPGAPAQVEARQNLQRLVFEARAAVVDGGRAVSLNPAQLNAVPGTRTAEKAAAEQDPPPLVNATEARVALERAMSKGLDVEMVYLSKTDQRVTVVLQPERIAYKAEASFLVGMDRAQGSRATYALDRIERLRVLG